MMFIDNETRSEDDIEEDDFIYDLTDYKFSYQEQFLKHIRNVVIIEPYYEGLLVEYIW